MDKGKADGQGQFILKVCLEKERDAAYSNGFWREFRLDVLPNPKAPPYPSGDQPVGIFFDLILQDASQSGNHEAKEAALISALPHLRTAGDVIKAAPCVLMERAPFAEVEMTRKKLEMAGFKVYSTLTEARG